MGWTWEYVDDYMTLPRLNQLAKYWKENPPLHLMVAQYLGLSNKAVSNDEDAQEKNSKELFGLASEIGLSSEKPEWLKTIA